MCRHETYIYEKQGCIYTKKGSTAFLRFGVPDALPECVFVLTIYVRSRTTCWTETTTAAASVKTTDRGAVPCIGKTKTYVVVAIAGRVVVAIRHTAVLRVVVPRPAAYHTVGAFGGCPMFLK